MTVDNLIENAWAFVRAMEKQLIVVGQFGSIKFYTFDDFRPKSRDFFANEVMGGREVTSIIENFGAHTVIQDKVILEQRILSIEKRNFSFSHDQFEWYKSITNDKF
jgi:hypothetical protein